VTSAIATSSRIGLPGRFCTFLPPRYRTAPSRSAITKLKFTPMYNIKPAVSPPKGSVEGLPRAMRPGEDRNDTSETREDLLRDPKRALDDDPMELDAGRRRVCESRGTPCPQTEQDRG
jgi:hypothetical protein